MKNIKLLSVVVVLTITTGVFAFAEQIQLTYPALAQIFQTSNNERTSVPSQNPERVSEKRIGRKIESTAHVPDEIIYFVLFNHLVGLKDQAAKAAAKGKSLDYLQMYQDQANLGGAQAALLFETAQNCMDEVKLIDKEAKEIIDQARQKFRDKDATSPDEIPEAPKELKDLQKKKDETVLRFRDLLKEALGEGNFSEFNNFARGKVAPHITTNLKGGEVK